MSSQYYTLAQASKRLGESVRTLRRRIANGHLVAKRGPYPNSPILINSLDLAAYDNRRQWRREEVLNARR